MKPSIRIILFVLSAIGSSLTMILAQDVTVKLSTNDNSSRFNVTRNNGTSLFKVDGSGAMSGDGSGLSNLRSQAAYAGGNSNVAITSYDPYYPTLVQYVELTVPGPGIIIVQATGYIQYLSHDMDYIRACIIDNTIATGSASFGSNYFSYLFLSCDFNCVDTVEIYSSLALSRAFTVSSAGTYRYNLWADKGYASCTTKIADANMQTIYIPTGGTGPAGLMAKTSHPDEPGISDLPLIPGSLDGHSPAPAISKGAPVKPAGSSTVELKALKAEVATTAADNQALKTELSSIRDENRSLKARLEALERRLDTLP